MSPPASSGRRAALLLLLGAMGAVANSQPAGAGPAADQPGRGKRVSAADARGWLEKMNTALATRNYHGVFVHQHGKRRETLRIIHRVQDGMVTERLLSLDGNGREFVRNGTELTCYFPDHRVVIVERRPHEQGFIDGLPGIGAGTEENYEIRSSESRSMEGRPTRLIELTPRDGFRYGYRLWIDEKTAMPIKTQMCDGRGNVIEQIEFASLRLPARIDDALLQPAVATAGFRWLRHEVAPLRDASAAVWQALRLPPGFRLRARSDQGMAGSSLPVSHLVFTDGVASVSVFIEAQDERHGDRWTGTKQGAPAQIPAGTQLGSAAAYSTLVAGHRVTAVGEVPPTTVRFIAQSMQATSEQPEAATAAAGGGSPGNSREPRSRHATPAAPSPELRSGEAPGLASPQGRTLERNSLRESIPAR